MYNAKRRRLTTKSYMGSYNVDVVDWLDTVIPGGRYHSTFSENVTFADPIPFFRPRNNWMQDFSFVQFQQELGQLQRNLAARLQAFFRNNFRRTRFGIVSNYRQNRFLRAIQEYVKTQITLMR